MTMQNRAVKMRNNLSAITALLKCSILAVSKKTVWYKIVKDDMFLIYASELIWNPTCHHPSQAIVFGVDAESVAYHDDLRVVGKENAQNESSS